MLPGHSISVRQEKAHPGRDCGCVRYTVRCRCGFEESAGTSNTGTPRRVHDIELQHRLVTIERAIVDAAALNQQGADSKP